jgi:hypothetical protein
VRDIRVIFYPIMYLSPFKYGFQGGLDALGISTKIEPRTPSDLFSNLLILVGIGFFFRLVSILAMQKISNPKRPKLLKISEELSQVSQEKIKNAK